MRHAAVHGLARSTLIRTITIYEFQPHGIAQIAEQELKYESENNAMRDRMSEISNYKEYFVAEGVI